MECAKLFIKTGNRDMLDSTLLTVGALVGDRLQPDGTYEVKCIEDTVKAANARGEMIASICKQQGYGEVVRIEPAT